jgi:hypothetical protein
LRLEPPEDDRRNRFSCSNITGSISDIDYPAMMKEHSTSRGIEAQDHPLLKLIKNKFQINIKTKKNLIQNCIDDLQTMG